jgi:hypothetical protein
MRKIAHPKRPEERKEKFALLHWCSEIVESWKQQALLGILVRIADTGKPVIRPPLLSVIKPDNARMGKLQSNTESMAHTTIRQPVKIGDRAEDNIDCYHFSQLQLNSWRRFAISSPPDPDDIGPAQGAI